MSVAFHRDLAELRDELAAMSALATASIALATQALLDADLHLAEQVISADAELDERSARCEELACALLGQPAPGQRELRSVVAAIKVAEKVERMGDLARHVAELARRRHPSPVLPGDLRDRFALLGRLATDAGRRVEQALAAPTGDRLAEQELADDAIDQLRDELLDQVRRAEPPYLTQVGVDVALLARFYERFADQAVTVTRQLDYAVTGQTSV